MRGEGNVIQIKEREYEGVRKYLNEMNHKETIDKQEIIEMTNCFLNLLDERKEQDLYQYYFCYMMKSKCYCRLNNLPTALKFNRIALDYIKKSDISYNEKIRNLLITWWGLGRIYGEMGNLKLSMHYYNKCEKQYRKVNNTHFLAKILNAKAYYLRKEPLIKRAIELESSVEDIDMIEKKNTLTDMYDTKFNIYIDNQDFQNAWNTIGEIHFNNTLKINLIKRYRETIENNCNQLAL